MKKLVAIMLLIVSTSCSNGNDIDNCATLISSKKTYLYILSYNWGLNSDNQISTISIVKRRLHSYEKDSSYIVRGLMPFIYEYSYDTLNIYSINEINHFKLYETDIKLRYSVIDAYKFNKLLAMARSGNQFHLVPEYSGKEYKDIPKPGSDRL